MEHLISITEIVSAMDKGFILDPEYDSEILNNTGACAGLDCQTCKKCDEEGEI